MEKLKKIKAEFDYYKNLLWDSPRGKGALELTFAQLWVLLKKIKPSKIEGDVIFGMKDPADTGQALGAIGALYGFLPKKLHITPDFENERYEGKLHVKGKLRLIHVVVIGLKLIVDKNFRYVVKKVLAKEGSKNE